MVASQRTPVLAQGPKRAKVILSLSREGLVSPGPEQLDDFTRNLLETLNLPHYKAIQSGTALNKSHVVGCTLMLPPQHKEDSWFGKIYNNRRVSQAQEMGPIGEAELRLGVCSTGESRLT